MDFENMNLLHSKIVKETYLMVWWDMDVRDRVTHIKVLIPSRVTKLILCQAFLKPWSHYKKLHNG